MFRSQRSQILSESHWAGLDIDNGECLGYVEALRHPNGKRTIDWGKLNDDGVKHWLLREPKNCEGSVRLLVCERSGAGMSFAMKQSTFESLELSFRLHQITLPILGTDEGMYTRYVKFKGTGTARKAVSIDILIKAPQMYHAAPVKHQTGNFGLSIHHSFEAKTTRAFIFGMECANDAFIQHIANELDHESHLWENPLLLATMMLQDHQERVWRFRNVSSYRASDLERKLGVTFFRQPGDNLWAPPNPHILDDMEGEELRTTITTVLYTVTRDVIALLRITDWCIRCQTFLKQTHLELESLDELDGEMGSEIDALGCLAGNTDSLVRQLKSRLDLQLDVLYNFTSQADSRISSRLAATSGLDSAAMKTLALVTTLFLPATFVATVFSMSMFNWDSQSTTGENTVDAVGFGIYWAVSVPLTAAVFLGWRVWWSYQKWYYKQRYPQAGNPIKEEGFGPLLRRWVREGRAGDKNKEVVGEKDKDVLGIAETERKGNF